MTQEQKITWMAAILEGEGCFHLRMHKTKSKDYPSFMVVLKMCDEDVIKRFYHFAGFGRFLPLKKREGFPEKYKPIATWRAAGRDDVERICRMVLPFMGERRSQKIKDILKAINEYPSRRIWQHGTRQGYEKGCRCEQCTECHRLRFEARRRRLGVPVKPVARHGTRTMYVKGCRCDGCVQSDRRYAKMLRERKSNTLERTQEYPERRMALGRPKPRPPESPS